VWENLTGETMCNKYSFIHPFHFIRFHILTFLFNLSSLLSVSSLPFSLSLSLPAHTANIKPLTFDEVYNQSSPTNCTVYIGGVGGSLSGELTEEILQKKFSPFGTIQEIRVFKDKGYAFVRFSTKEAATHAIVAVHNSEINQQTVKCSWGKESGDPNNVPAIAASQALSPTGYPFGYGQQVAGYWYPPTAPTAAYPTTPAHLQSQWQGMQSYAYGQFAGYQQAGYMG
jgi:nucleolysin TIA-1/TIAR